MGRSSKILLRAKGSCDARRISRYSGYCPRRQNCGSAELLPERGWRAPGTCGVAVRTRFPGEKRMDAFFAAAHGELGLSDGHRVFPRSGGADVCCWCGEE